MPGPVSAARARSAPCSHRSPSSRSPMKIIEAARVSSAGAITGSVPQPYRSAAAIASRPRGGCYRLAAAQLGNGERVDLRREPELRQAADLEIGSADLPSQDGALLQVAFGVRKRQGPRLDRPQVHQRHRAQVAAERDVLIRLPGYRRVEEFDLLENVGQVP